MRGGRTGVLVDERLLNGVRIIDSTQAFDRKDRLTVTIAHDCCAGCAVPDTATGLRSVQVDVVLDAVENGHVGIVHIRGERVPWFHSREPTLAKTIWLGRPNTLSPAFHQRVGKFHRDQHRRLRNTQPHHPGDHVMAVEKTTHGLDECHRSVRQNLCLVDHVLFPPALETLLDGC